MKLVTYICSGCEGMGDCSLTLNEVKRPPQYCPFIPVGEVKWNEEAPDVGNGLSNLFK